MESVAGESNKTSAIRIASWNLRYDCQPDNLTVEESIARLPNGLDQPKSYYPTTKELPWSRRRLDVANTLIFEKVELFGVQEGLIRQLNDLQKLLGSEWGWVGVGRDDGVQAGEYSAIFYKKPIVRLVDWDSFWLSDTPFQPSRYPGAGSYRVCTTAHFELLSNSRQFTVINAHLDERSDPQRKLAASLMLARAKYEALGADGTGSKPVFILGDFNSSASDSNSGAYKITTGQQSPTPIDADFASKYAVQGGGGFKGIDLRGAAPKQNISGHFATYTGFSSTSNYRDFQRIDFIFGGSNGGWKVTSYKVGNTLSDEGVYSSDHRPVLVDIVM